MTDQTPEGDHNDQPLRSRDVYNIVTDVGVGPNVRMRDNLLQGLVIVIAAIIGILVGAFFIQDRLAGCVLGGFVGLLVGLFGSGIFLMIYRAARHLRGKHD
ncbi:MAG TPA: hypothetical protein VFB96_10025 [Pirellulaceae bacterium]|nr:hypothetical protein [Pirellulaceae bacterium]